MEGAMVPYQFARNLLCAAGISLCLLARTVGGCTLDQPAQPVGEKPVQPGKPDPSAKPADADKKPEQPPQDAQQPEKKAPEPGATSPQPPAPTPKTADPSLNDPSVDQIIKDMDKSKEPRKAVAPATAPAVESPRPKTRSKPGTSNARARLLREGTFLTSRRGRVVRSSGGDWEFVFDADARGDADPTMILMPCLNLAGMERIAEKKGEAATFTVTGQVFIYRDRNYLLPTLYQVDRPERDIRTSQ
jgi:hypothetical protein